MYSLNETYRFVMGVQPVYGICIAVLPYTAWFIDIETDKLFRKQL